MSRRPPTVHPYIPNSIPQVRTAMLEAVGRSGGGRIPRAAANADVALAVRYFASDDSAWVTGSVLIVDVGGLA